MLSQTGKRVLSRREMYSGRRRRGKKKKTTVDKNKVMGVKMLLCVGMVALTLALKIFYPTGADFIYNKLSNGLDYTAAFGALGEAISSGDNIKEVFRGIAVGGFNKTDAHEDEQDLPIEEVKLPDAVEASTPLVPIPDITDFIDKSAVGDIDDEAEVNEEEYFEELLLRLPSEELDDGTDSSDTEPPETVSYDYYVIEFDYVSPIKGKVTSGFGYRSHPISKKYNFHYGLDIAGKKGSDILAFASGTIELTGYNSIYGNYLFIRHKDGIITFYGHCNKIVTEKGQLVQKGDIVAKVGDTGYSTGPHLHFEIRNGGVILNPIHYISPESA